MHNPLSARQPRGPGASRVIESQHQRKSRRLLPVIVMAAAFTALLLGAIPSSADTAPTVTTDKNKYYLGETMLISGAGFTANGNVIVSVARPDRVTDTLPATPVSAAGTFATPYTPQPSVPGRYRITATDGTNTARTASTEADNLKTDFLQCANNDGNPAQPGRCNWIGSILQAANSRYFEGFSTLQHLMLDQIPATTGDLHTLAFDLDATKDGQHAFDFLTTWDSAILAAQAIAPGQSLFPDMTVSASPGAAGNVNACNNFGVTTGNQPSLDAVCRTVRSAGNTFAVAKVPIGDANVAGDIAAANTAYAARFPGGGLAMRLYGSAGIGSALLTFDGYDNPIGNQVAHFTLTWTSPSSSLLVEFGAHIAMSADLFGDHMGYGLGLGAANINGGPFHVMVITLDGHPTGAQDNQLKGADILRPPETPTITTAIHSGATDGTAPLVVTSVALGSTAHDSAAVQATPNNGIPTGSITFYWFGNSVTCPTAGTSGGTALNTVALNAGGIADPSTAQGPLAAGPYNFKAVYTSNNLSKWRNAEGACEQLIVNTASTTLTTELHKADETVLAASSSVPLGTTIDDKAMVSGQQGTIGFTGTVNFTFFTNATCDGDGSPSVTSIALVSGVAHPSTNQGPLTAGDYSFRAAYPGDSNYNSSTSGCEPFSVNKAPSSTATELHLANETVVAPGTYLYGPTTMHDKAAVSGQVGAIAMTGTVDFTFFNNEECDGTGTASGTGIALVSGVAHPSTSQGPLASGEYAFRAAYSGDASYEPSVSACEPFDRGSFITNTATELHNADESVVANAASVALATTMHDKATISGEDPAAALTGTVDFTFFTNGTCDGAGSASGSIAVVSRVAHPSSSQGPLGAGSYSFKAAYSGDANYRPSAGDCEPFAVTKASTTLATELHKADETVIAAASGVPLATIMHDKATVTGQQSTITISGAVDFTFYANATCTGDGIASGTGIALANGIAHPSTGQGPLGAGDYAFRAAYSGDANYTASTSDCEPFSVTRASTALATELHNADETVVAAASSLPLATTMHDKATVTGQQGTIAISGTVDFTFYTNDACTGAGAPSGTGIAVVTGIAHPSTSHGPLTVGGYAFKAAYSGDSNYTASTSGCEPFSVVRAATTIATELHKADETVVAVNSSVPLPVGTTMHDKATVSGQRDAISITGTVDFTFFTNATCTGGTSSGAGIALVSDVAHPSASQGPLSAGTYSFRAAYGGDANYLASTSDCEAFYVNDVKVIKTQTVGGVLTNVSVQYTFCVFDGSVGAANATYDASKCKRTLVDDQPVGSGNLDFGPKPAGAYSVCELAVPAGTHSTLADLPGATTDATNGNSCLAFSLGAGDQKTFNIDDSRPGGGQRTIGYWKNWNSCSHDGAFVERAIKTGNHLADEFLAAVIPFGALTALDCPTANKILGKQDTSGQQQGGDAAYNLAAQLLAARLNVASGAGVSNGATNAISDGMTLLGLTGGTLSDGFVVAAADAARFNDTGTYWKGGKNASALRAEALKIAGILDQYNNGKLP